MPEDKNLQTFDSITKVVLIFTLNKFKTHTAIMVRTLPETSLIIIKIYLDFLNIYTNFAYNIRYILLHTILF